MYKCLSVSSTWLPGEVFFYVNSTFSAVKMTAQHRTGQAVPGSSVCYDEVQAVCNG